MHILFSGYHNPYFMTITEYMEDAIRALGHDLTVFDDRQHIVPGRIRQSIHWLQQYDLRHINKKLVSLALKSKPDIAVVTGGHRITRQSVQALKKNRTCPVLWTIDAPSNFEPIIDVAPVYDHVFCQGSEAVELLNCAGIEGAQWLPVGCDPNIHKPIELSPEEKRYYGSDVVFVGSYYQNRAEVFESLVDFDLAIWGPGWERLEKKSKLKRCIRTAHTTPSEWAKIYSASKIVLAPHYQDPTNTFPMYQASPRVFEALACRAFVMSDNQRDVFSLFKDGEHLVRFNDAHDLVEKITWYLGHLSERQRIAAQGYDEVTQKHTYVRRIEKLIESVNHRNA